MACPRTKGAETSGLFLQIKSMVREDTVDSFSQFRLFSEREIGLFHVISEGRGIEREGRHISALVRKSFVAFRWLSGGIVCSPSMKQRLRNLHFTPRDAWKDPVPHRKGIHVSPLFIHGRSLNLCSYRHTGSFARRGVPCSGSEWTNLFQGWCSSTRGCAGLPPDSLPVL